MSALLGIDPGIIGAWAVVNDLGGLIAADDLPVVGEGAQRMIAAPLLADVLGRYQPTTATVERVGSMPGQGVSSSFKFGRAVGVIDGVLGAAACPVMYVAPAIWKKHFRLVQKRNTRANAQLRPGPIAPSNCSRGSVTTAERKPRLLLCGACERP